MTKGRSLHSRLHEPPDLPCWPWSQVTFTYRSSWPSAKEKRALKFEFRSRTSDPRYLRRVVRSKGTSPTFSAVKGLSQRWSKDRGIPGFRPARPMLGESFQGSCRGLFGEVCALHQLFWASPLHYWTSQAFLRCPEELPSGQRQRILQ